MPHGRLLVAAILQSQYLEALYGSLTPKEAYETHHDGGMMVVKSVEREELAVLLRLPPPIKQC